MMGGPLGLVEDEEEEKVWELVRGLDIGSVGVEDGVEVLPER